MSRESKILKSGAFGAEKTIYHYESFGWELLSLNGDTITMSRETQNPVYADLIRNEAKYEQLVRDYNAVRNPNTPQKPAPFLLKRCCILLLLFVVPGALYIAYKVNQNKQYNESMSMYHNEMAACNKKRNDIMAKIEQLLMDSRATFFGQH